MPTYRYHALDTTGKEIHGTLRAETAERVEERLMSLDLFPVAIKEVKATQVQVGFFRPKVSMRMLIDFTSGLATVIASGMPLIQGLKAIGDQLKNRTFMRVIEEVVRAVSAGERLAIALAAHPSIFPEFYTKVVDAGEQGGNLELVLQDLADLLETQEEIRSRVRDALIYPAFVMVTLAGLIFIFLAFVLPKLFSVIQELRMPLPALTVAVITVSTFFQKYWYLVLAGIVALGILYRWMHSFASTRRWIDSVKLRLPVVGNVLWMVSVARFARYLAIFHRAGLLLTDGLDLSAQVVGNRVISSGILQVKTHILEGRTLSHAFEMVDFIPPMLVLMTRVGEESGELEKTLRYVADYYEREATKAIKRALTLLEPILILLVAFFVGLSLASVILPIYSIYNYIR
ncbi:MAG: type II secretion system F family protein [bacterium JZ-2024 1]